MAHSRQLSSMINQDNYEYELKKLMEQERQLMAIQVRNFIDNI
jgi:hypothetical protein